MSTRNEAVMNIDETSTLRDLTLSPSVGTLMVSTLDLGLTRFQTPSILNRVNWPMVLVLAIDLLVLWAFAKLVMGLFA